MYEDEMRDLELTYLGAIQDMQAEIEKNLPMFMDSMERFVKLTRGEANIKRKLAILRSKMSLDKAIDEHDDGVDCDSEVCDGE